MDGLEVKLTLTLNCWSCNYIVWTSISEKGTGRKLHSRQLMVWYNKIKAGIGAFIIIVVNLRVSVVKTYNPDATHRKKRTLYRISQNYTTITI